jgi:hypothetical protein
MDQQNDRTPRGVAFFFKNVCSKCTEETTCKYDVVSCAKIEEILILRDIKEIILNGNIVGNGYR